MLYTLFVADFFGSEIRSKLPLPDPSLENINLNGTYVKNKNEKK